MSVTRVCAIAGAVALSVGAFLTFGSGSELRAQNRKNFSLVNDEAGHVALGLAIRRLNVVGTFMQAPAHPDDESNAVLALYARGAGLRVIDLQNNRGEGGQNEIGPELFHDMGVLRTSELLAAHHIDGAEQYFTRAIDYGYSFDPQEVIATWGREAIVGDYVRLIRTLRPDVILTMNIQGSGGDRAHEATTVLVQEAYAAAGDASRYPEQLRDGLRPWHPLKLYFAGGGPVGGRRGAGATGRVGVPGGGAPAAGPAPAAAPSAGVAAAHVTRIDTSVYDALLGRTYAEIGTDARSAHKCQGVGGVPPLPGGLADRGAGGAGGGGAYTLVASTIAGAMDRDELSFMEGIDTTLAGLTRFAGSAAPAALTTALAALTAHAQQARQAFESGEDAATAAPLEKGLVALRALRAQLASLGLPDEARFEIDFRLANEEQDYEAAMLAALGLSFQAVADDGLVIAGQSLRVSGLVVNHGASPVMVSGVGIAGLDGASSCTPSTVGKDGVFTCAVTATVPPTARVTDVYFTDGYWQHPGNPARSSFESGVAFGVPFAPTPFRIAFRIRFGDVEVVKDVPIGYRYVKDLYFGDKRMEVNVVPAFSVAATPGLAVFPTVTAASAAATEREVFVTVTNATKGAAQAAVSLEVPVGWRGRPSTVPVAFDKEDESRSARFVVTAPLRSRPGSYAARAVVTSALTGTQRFATGYQEIEYPHIERRQVIKATEVSMKVMDVRVAPSLEVGYVMGVGDQVPPAIQQLGAKLRLIDSDDLAWGSLAKYDVVVTGVRAYERRADLRAYNRRLLDYAAAGGTVIVQYNKMEFNQAQYGPYPASVGQGRVSDERVAVTVLHPNHPVFTYPNRIGAAAWQDWVQERGLYFLGEKNPKYVDLVSMVDSFADNAGEKLGSLVEAQVGKGRWIYVGLALWRQLPAGTPGAYQLMANLISLPKAPRTSRPQ
ncbi:MAG: PIG-L family deacetylase [Vicinamibacterales bacterium]